MKMKMIRKVVSIFLMIFCMEFHVSDTHAQEIVDSLSDSFTTLDQVTDMAVENYPKLMQLEVDENTRQLDYLKADWSYLPVLVLSASASYNTEVISFPDLFYYIGGFDKLSKDQYNATVYFEQRIWDGGKASLDKKMADSKSALTRAQTMVDVHSYKEKIMDMYFGVLLMEEAITQIDLTLDRLDVNYRVVSDCFESGIASATDLDKMKVRIIEVEQKREDLVSTAKSLRRSLSVLAGKDFSDIEFRKPVLIAFQTGDDFSSRPEYAVFDEQSRMYDNAVRQVDIRKIPQFSLVLQGTYGRPGPNMLDNSFRPFGYVGLKMQWNISGFFYSGKVKKLMSGEYDGTVDMNRSLFEMGVRQKIQEQKSTIEKLEKLVSSDEEVLRLRKRIRESAEAQVDRGVMSVTELLDNISQENEASLGKIIHEMELLKAVYSLKHTLNR